MYYRLKKLYETKRLSTQGLVNAVENTWITEAEYMEITGFIYPETESASK